MPLEKLVNRKHFPVKEKFSLVSRKVFSFYFGRKTLFESCENFRNVILFADYIKFSPQTFDCYIYILFWIFAFQFHPLEFNFYINFGSYFYNCYLLLPYHFLIEIFFYLVITLSWHGSRLWRVSPVNSELTRQFFFSYLVIKISRHESQVWRVNLVWRVNPVNSYFFSFSSLVFFFMLIFFFVFSF